MGIFYLENSFQKVIKRKRNSNPFIFILEEKTVKNVNELPKIEKQSQSLPMDVYYVDTKEETQQDLLRQFFISLSNQDSADFFRNQKRKSSNSRGKSCTT